MRDLLVVFGATSRQGRSVIDFVLNEPTLRAQFKVRAVTLDSDSSLAHQLDSKGIEVVKADYDKPDTIKEAAKEAHTIYASTKTVYSRDGKYIEKEHGKAVADAAELSGAHLIWSSAPQISSLTHGKLEAVFPFDAKAEIEQYIKSLSIKATFFVPGVFIHTFFANNLPQPVADNRYEITGILDPYTKIPFFDIEDTGTFVGLILADPESFVGKHLVPALYKTPEEVAQSLTIATGKLVNYRKISDDAFKNRFTNLLAPTFTELYLFLRDYEYFGNDTEKVIKWTNDQVEGTPTLVDDYLVKRKVEF